MVLDYAISKEYLSVNPISNVKIKKKVLTLEQREKKKEKISWAKRIETGHKRYGGNR